MTESGGGRMVVLPPDLQAGKRATKSLIKAAGGQEEAASITGKSQPRLSSYGLPNTGDFIPVDAAHALEAVTHGQPGHPHVTRWLAHEAGYLLVRKPSTVPADTDWCPALGDAVQEFSDVQQRILKALPGGVSARELIEANVRGEIEEAMGMLARLDALCARAIEDGGGG